MDLNRKLFSHPNFLKIAVWNKLKGMLIMSASDWQILLDRKNAE